MEELVGGLKKFWSTLGTVQKAVVIGIPALLIIGAVAAFTLVIAAPPVKATLFKSLDLADASKIVAELRKNNVDFELQDEGTKILVPATEVYELRLQMVGIGLPMSNAGFELFDESKLGETERGSRIKFQRALQGELARTLESWDTVEQASVLLSIAPETSFLDTDAHSTAAVTLHLTGGRSLSKSQVEGVRILTSGAVSRLDPADVMIVDGSGNPLSGEDFGKTDEMLASLAATELQEEIRKRREREMEQSIRELLEPAFGVGNVSPSVSVEMDFREIHKESEEYTPVIGDQGIERRVEEHRSKEESATDTPGGVPGTTSNIPGYLGISGGEDEAKESSTSDLIIDYEINREIVTEDLPKGVVTKRPVAVALSTDELDSAATAEIEMLVANAIGADVDAGDSISVKGFLVSDAAQVALTQEYISRARAQSISKIAGWVVALLMFVVLALLLRSLVSAAFPKDELALAAAGVPARKGLGVDVTAADLTMEEIALQRLDEVGETHQDKMRAEIHRLIDEHPETVITLLRTWLLEDT